MRHSLTLTLIALTLSTAAISCTSGKKKITADPTTEPTTAPTAESTTAPAIVESTPTMTPPAATTVPAVAPAAKAAPVVQPLPATKPAAAPATKPAPAMKPVAVTTKPASTQPATKPTTKPTPSVPWQASMKRDKEGNPEPGFMRQHEAFLERGKKDVGLLLLGDSITAGWTRAKADYDAAFGPHQPANFGIGGDRTEHVLWRIANGELDTIKPKVVMLMIGTNNGGKTEDITRGVVTVVDAIKAKLPASKILLLAIFPRGDDPAKPNVAAGRKKLDTINAELAKLDDGKQVKYLDIGAKFLDDKGVITKEIMPDALHPSAAGYKIWADAVKPVIDEMMK